MAEEAAECADTNDLAFELISNADNYPILFNIIDLGCPYMGANNDKFQVGPRFKARQLALEVLHNMGMAEGVGSFVSSNCKK